MSEKPRILVFDGTRQVQADPLMGCADHMDLVRVATLGEGLQLLRREAFDGIFAATRDPRKLQRLQSLLQTDGILEKMGEGVAVVAPDLCILWANPTLELWCGGPVQGRKFYEALGSPEILGPEFSPFYRTPPIKPVSTRLHRGHQFLELRVAPVFDETGRVQQFLAMCRDVTAEVHQQQKLDALHQAANELASLAADQLAEMDVDERIELLKHNIRKLTHDLLHYDVVEIRLLDPVSGRLEPLLSDGMTTAASDRVLYAREEGNGVTGYVAATGKSYICTDTAADPRYLEGAEGARSSLTVALTWGDKVIGTFNVESPQPNSFGPEDLQFTEIFCRELASALHTLELLLVEKRTSTTASLEAVSREVALPLDEILNAATSLLERWIGHEPEMADKIRKILTGARAIRQSIRKVGEEMAIPVGPLPQPAAEEPPPGLQGLRVLVVDLDERVRRSAHALLGRFGCIVETAGTGREALTMARLSPYDAMIADIRLPDLSGYEVYQALRDARPHAKVILMTGFGYDSSHSIVKARQEGLKHVLYKPFRVEQMVAALQADEPSSPDRIASRS